MQATKSLELRMPTGIMDETAFAQLAESLQTLGIAMETDVDRAKSSHVAWFDPAAVSMGDVQAALIARDIDCTTVQLRILENEGWETAWQKDWHAMPVGQRLWVRPSFCEPPVDDRCDIVLDPGMAFGTGTHPTTQLCLEALERLCCVEDDGDDGGGGEKIAATLLDMGAGSGLLAIAALKLGMREALAIDMEEESVEACKVNAAINAVALDVCLGDTPPQGQFDVVVANILAAPLLWMAEELAACVGSHLILSGLLSTQVDDIAAAYVAEGLVEIRRDHQQEWASVEFVRSGLCK